MWYWCGTSGKQGYRPTHGHRKCVFRTWALLRFMTWYNEQIETKTISVCWNLHSWKVYMMSDLSRSPATSIIDYSKSEVSSVISFLAQKGVSFPLEFIVDSSKRMDQTLWIAKTSPKWYDNFEKGGLACAMRRGAAGRLRVNTSSKKVVQFICDLHRRLQWHTQKSFMEGSYHKYNK